MMEDGVAAAALALMDPETRFLYSKQQTGNEWELFKENVRPLKRGRKVEMLNTALKLNLDCQIKKCLLEKRRELINAIDEYEGEDPLQPWVQCIKWVQESFPPGGDSSGLIVIYEQCVRKFWHDERYKNDLGYLKIWLEYVESCADAEVIFSFLDANGIGQTHADFYISYALLMEKRNKYKRADDIFNCGLAGNAQPKEKLEAAYKKFFVRSMRRSQPTEDSMESDIPTRSFGTALSREDNRRLNMKNSVFGNKNLHSNGVQRAPLAVYKDSHVNIANGQLHDLPKTSKAPWQNLGTQMERNKENKAIPSKWTSHKIPQNPASRTSAVEGPRIEVFVDEECQEVHKKEVKDGEKSSTLKLKEGDGLDLKKETQLLREHPLRNFPRSSLPR